MWHRNVIYQYKTEVIAALLMAAGIYFPLIKTTKGYTYTISGTGSTVCFSVIAISILFNILLTNEQNKAKIDQLVSITYFVVVGYSLRIASEGIEWFYRQTVFDMPSWDKTNQDVYWKMLANMSEMGLTELGSLRDIYQNFGSEFTFNGQPIFQMAVNGLSFEQTKNIALSAGDGIFYYPFGLSLMIGGLIIQILQTRLSMAKLKTPT